MKCNETFCPIYFSMKVSILAVVFCWQISKNWQFCLKMLVFWHLLPKYSSQHGNLLRKVIRTKFCISLPIYPLHFPKFCPIPKQKTLRNCRCLVKTNPTIYLIFYKLVFFETLIIFLEPTIKSITGIFDMKKL